MGRPRDSAERFYERFGAGDLDGAAGLFSSDCTHVTPAGQQDANAWKAFAEAFRRALPDAHMEIVSVVEAGDAVAIEARFRGTHRGAPRDPAGRDPCERQRHRRAVRRLLLAR
jgi:ketosteroid isomerase-like protein